jgi:hypothetical protein
MIVAYAIVAIVGLSVLVSALTCGVALLRWYRSQEADHMGAALTPRVCAGCRQTFDGTDALWAHWEADGDCDVTYGPEIEHSEYWTAPGADGMDAVLAAEHAELP